MPSASRIGRFCVALLCFAAPARAADITVVGAWPVSLAANDLVAGAGTDLRSPIESAAAQVALTISNTGGANWSVTVSENASLWPVGATLFVRVASTGSGAGGVSSNGAYLPLGAAGQTLLSGTGDRAGVQLQFKGSGFSVRNALGNYSATIIYTLQ